MLDQGVQRPIGLIPHNYLLSDLNIFNKKSYLFCCLCFDNFLLLIKSRPKGRKGLLGISLEFFCFIFRMLVTFSCLWSMVFLKLAKEALRPIGVIPWQFSSRIVLIFSKNDLCVKTGVAIIFRKIKNESHCRQNIN